MTLGYEGRISPGFLHHFGAESVAPSARAQQARVADDATPAAAAAAKIFDRGSAEGLSWFRVLEAAEVAEEVRRVTYIGVRLARATLGIEAPTVTWFRPESAAEHAYRSQYGAADLPVFRYRPTIAGIASWLHNTIAVATHFPLSTIAEAAAHECYHTAYQSTDEQGDEAEALAFGLRARELLVSRRSGRVVDLHVFDRCPLKTSLGEGVAAEDDVAIAPESDGGRAVFKNWGGRSRPEWKRAADLPLPR